MERIRKTEAQYGVLATEEADATAQAANGTESVWEQFKEIYAKTEHWLVNDELQKFHLPEKQNFKSKKNENYLERIFNAINNSSMEQLNAELDAVLDEQAGYLDIFKRWTDLGDENDRWIEYQFYLLKFFQETLNAYWQRIQAGGTVDAAFYLRALIALIQHQDALARQLNLTKVKTLNNEMLNLVMSNFVDNLFWDNTDLATLVARLLNLDQTFAQQASLHEEYGNIKGSFEVQVTKLKTALNALTANRYRTNKAEYTRDILRQIRTLFIFALVGLIFDLLIVFIFKLLPLMIPAIAGSMSSAALYGSIAYVVAGTSLVAESIISRYCGRDLINNQIAKALAIILLLPLLPIIVLPAAAIMFGIHLWDNINSKLAKRSNADAIQQLANAKRDITDPLLLRFFDPAPADVAPQRESSYAAPVSYSPGLSPHEQGQFV